jgi:hypothetical protein
MTEALSSFETSVLTTTTRRNIPEDDILNTVIVPAGLGTKDKCAGEASTNLSEQTGTGRLKYAIRKYEGFLMLKQTVATPL